MKNIRKHYQGISILFISLFLFSCGTNSYSLPTPAPSEDVKGTNQINIGLLLDTSSSMNGLIEQAKSQLWKIVNVLSMAKKNGENATLSIALYQYGNSGLSGRNGYIEQILPLTNDLDEISEKLFSLSTNGGDEYCGQVIQTATNQLAWDSLSTSLNLLFIAGNEGFNQGSINYRNSCSNAKEHGITVNTIFCGDYQMGIETEWKNGATLTGGNYMNIDMNEKTVYVATPYDEKISQLNDSLNTTYLSYGSQGRYKKDNQLKQDNNASSYGLMNKVSRSVSKSSSIYLNSQWDLVDASKQKGFDLKEIDKSTLPSVMKGLSEAKQLEYIYKMAKKRSAFSLQIQQLNVTRIEYIASHSNSGETNSLDVVMTKAIKSQAIAKGFNFENTPSYPKANVDFDYFETITKEAKAHRSTSLIDFETFTTYSKENNTVILDTRSKRRYDKLHLKGAIHLNFSDFTQDYLAQIIPDTNTRILIYCNNNFSQITEIDSLKKMQELITQNFTSKSFTPVKIQLLNPNIPINTMALNIPTYINLYGYHYRNVYELDELVSVDNPLLELEGTDSILLEKTK